MELRIITVEDENIRESSSQSSLLICIHLSATVPVLIKLISAFSFLEAMKKKGRERERKLYRKNFERMER